MKEVIQVAITKMNSKTFIDTNERGVTSKERPPVSAGETMEIFIPKLMPYMNSGTPTIKSTITKGSMVFVNDSSCKPNVPTIVRSQNYISPKFENSASWSGIIDPSDPNPKVPAGTPVVVKFTSGNIQNPTFSPN